MSKAISIQNLQCSYGKKVVLKDVSFEVDENDIVFIMGNNGCGKTTILKCILNSVKYVSGNVFFLGKNSLAYSYRELAKVVSYVPQNINIRCDYNLKEYLVFGRNPHIMTGNPSSDDYKIVEYYSIKTGVIDYINQNFRTLSGGQKQMAAITRALIQETPIIILDEPMSALDLGKQAELISLFVDLKNSGKTILLTSHNPMHSLCCESKVCLLNNSVIAGFGAAEDVLTEKNIRDVYGEKINLSVADGSFKFVI